MKRVLFMLFMAAMAMAGEYACTFTQDGWKKEDWILLKSPRWDYIGGWVQKDGYIQNQVSDESLPGEKLQRENNFTSMVYKEPVPGNATISATMLFEYKMAPEIVLANSVDKNENGDPQYAEYWEIVLFNEGLNVWHHQIVDGKPFWRRAAFVNVPFEANTKYTMEAKVQFTSKCPILTVTCNGVKFGCMLPELKRNFYAGITGCEGINRFYDFKLTK